MSLTQLNNWIRHGQPGLTSCLDSSVNFRSNIDVILFQLSYLMTIYVIKCVSIFCDRFPDKHTTELCEEVQAPHRSHDLAPPPTSLPRLEGGHRSND